MMDADEVYRVVETLRRLHEQTREEQDRKLADLRARLDQLTIVLEGKGVLQPAHQQLFDKVGQRAAEAVRPRVRLRVFIDKYQMRGNDIDCEARLSLCHARCCSFTFELTTQDLDEGAVRWEVEAPYVIRHDNDGYCSHIDRKSHGCTIYKHRPAACRGFDCRGDPRIWIDFDQRIPAP